MVAALECAESLTTVGLGCVRIKMRLLVYISLIIPLVRSDTCDCDQINLDIEQLLRSVSDLKKANDDLTMRLDILESVRSSKIVPL